MRLPHTAHTSRPWRIHELTPDFRLEDVWALATPGGPGDFPRLVRLLAAGDPARGSSRAARALWAVRWKLGALLGWDEPDMRTLRDRLPQDLRDAPPGPDFDALPFTSLYLLDDEWAAEIANRTMHGVLHLGWVPDGTGRHRGQMAVLVKENGLLGAAYMRAIRPFRHLVVYPPAIRRIEREWRAGSPDDRLGVARQSYLAFAAGDRRFFEERLSAEFTFSSPADPRLDRAGWFERCWPAAGRGEEFDFIRIVESGDEVIVTYELRRPDGSGGFNTEVLTFDGDEIVRTEVYFGWDLS